MFKEFWYDLNSTVVFVLQNKRKMTIGEKAKYVAINVTGMTLVLFAKPAVHAVEKLKDVEADMTFKITMKK